MSRTAGNAFTVLAATIALAIPVAPITAQNFNQAPTVVGTKIADGQAYATVVVLEHQPNPSDNGRMLLAFEPNGWDGIPIYESTDHGATWDFVANAQDSTGVDRELCNLHWQPHLVEMPRTQHGIPAGTVLLSGSTLCQSSGAGRSQNMRLRLFTSRDLGRNWAYRSTYDEAAMGQPVWEPYLLILDDGTFVEYYSLETYKQQGYNQLLGHKVSHDGGLTWGPLIFDTAFRGGVERPGMVIIDRLPDGRYITSYEAVEGPVWGQVYVKFSADGLDWGDPTDRGTPVRTMSGRYAASTPNVFWFPIGGPDGVVVTTFREAEGPASDPAGNIIFWNNNLGEGPWWTAPTPVQKIHNQRAGWTQSMVLLDDGRLLHITSSGNQNPELSNNASNNEILYNAARINFNRYEAEDAGQEGTSVMRDGSRSGAAKSRLGAKDVGTITFEIHVNEGRTHTLQVAFTKIGFEAVPRLRVNGDEVTGSVTPVTPDPAVAGQPAQGMGARSSGQHFILTAEVDLRSGMNTVEIRGGDFVLDVDYLEVTPANR